MGKRWDEVHRVYNKGFKSSELSFYFDNTVPIWDALRKFTTIGNTIGSRLKRVASDSVTKKYQTNLYAQFPKTSLENVNFDFSCQYIIFENLQAKSLDMEYTFERKMFRARMGLEWCISRPIFEETSVDSC